MSMSEERKAALEQAVLTVSTNFYKRSQIVDLAGLYESYLLYGRVSQLPDNDFVTIAPECFTDGKVISLQGDNYYRGCNQFVSDLPHGGSSYCVKPVDHKSNVCEDMDGRVNHNTVELEEF